MSPGAHTGDGATDLIIVHNTSDLKYLHYLARTAFHTSHPFNLDCVQAVRVKQWEFVPQVKDGKSSCWNCDGEILDNQNIFVKCHKQLVPVFARGVYNPQLNKKTNEDDDEEDKEEDNWFSSIPAL